VKRTHRQLRLSLGLRQQRHLLFGYDMYTHSTLAGSNTLTLQVDIKVPD